jgi:predicted RecA/RadA family phage recombinase
MRFVIIAAVFTFSATSGIFAAPLGVTYTGAASTAEEIANKGRLDKATTDAHAQVQNMKTALANPDSEKVKPLLKAAFGEQGTNYDLNKVKNTVNALDKGNIHASIPTGKFSDPKTIAAVDWTKGDKKSDPWTPGAAQFGSAFHDTKKTTNAGRAGTVIHEATHQLSKTGDDVNKSGNIIKPYDGKSVTTGVTGYTKSVNPPKTAADVAKDKSYTAVRDSAKNMHDNAESYAVFASLCSQPGALARREDVLAFGRAVLEADDDELHFLLRRAPSCKLPAKNQAASPKAATPKAAAPAPKAPAPKTGRK